MTEYGSLLRHFEFEIGEHFLEEQRVLVEGVGRLLEELDIVEMLVILEDECFNIFLRF